MRKIAFILAVAIVALFVLTGAVETIADHHDCCGDHCPICLSFAALRSVLQTLTLICVCTFSGPVFLQRFGRNGENGFQNVAFLTPVSRFDLLLD